MQKKRVSCNAQCKCFSKLGLCYNTRAKKPIEKQILNSTPRFTKIQPRSKRKISASFGVSKTSMPFQETAKRTRKPEAVHRARKGPVFLSKKTAQSWNALLGGLINVGNSKCCIISFTVCKTGRQFN
ncbi:uncharacterized protein LOC134197766 [Corticium candelabrum]|uniref:uncharacterized protein LOC134197766 n=1 Tax=Corticium candelabrum TaxID=121492 RepID=UPI002E269CE1|nr:uncharacterized protein LOC134197766 [Corticium candelabrum]